VVTFHVYKVKIIRKYVIQPFYVFSLFLFLQVIYVNRFSQSSRKQAVREIKVKHFYLFAYCYLICILKLCIFFDCWYVCQLMLTYLSILNFACEHHTIIWKLSMFRSFIILSVASKF
jgi:hypothetical protein